MHPVAKVSFSTPLFFSLALLLSLHSEEVVLPAALAWLGTIQVFNAAAARMGRKVARCIHALHAFSFEFLALTGVAILRCFPDRQKIEGKGKPILLVHGYLNHGSVWNFQKGFFKNLNLGPIYTINLGYPFRRIEEYAEQVKVKADQIAKETGREELTLIGHSMGGLVSSWYAMQLASPGKVTDIITIGSPWVGTPMAYFALGENAKQMRPHSEFLKTLLSLMDKHPQIEFYHIASRSDQLVIPGDSAVLKNHDYLIIEDIGHSSLLYSRRVAHKIAGWLNALAAHERAG